MALLIQNCRIVNEGEIRQGDIRIAKGRISAIGNTLSARQGEKALDAKGMLLLPGLIDDQVHFRQPGLTHKADIFHESRAAAGGVTSFMDMPNVSPPTLTMALIEEKRAIAARSSLINYGFYLGATADNLSDIAAAAPDKIAGIKIFMGASTGDMLVDDEKTLEKIFTVAPTLIATHCENSARIARRLNEAKKYYGDNIPPAAHAEIRDAKACYESSSLAVALAKKTGARLHILHITTARELDLFDNGERSKKTVTAEACAHHLLFDESDYATLGMQIKCNPAIKSRADRDALRAAVAAGVIDVLATDHAPHLPEEKNLAYEKAAAGMPLVEYAMPAFLELVADGELQITDVVERGAHAVADIFGVAERGYIREGYYADLVLVQETPKGAPTRKKIISKCGWTPFANRQFRHRVHTTIVNGEIVRQDDKIHGATCGLALAFAR